MGTRQTGKEGVVRTGVPHSARMRELSARTHTEHFFSSMHVGTGSSVVTRPRAPLLSPEQTCGELVYVN